MYLYLVSLISTSTCAMEASFENFTVQSLGSLYLALKEDITLLQQQQQRQGKVLKKIQDEQGYLSLVVGGMQRDQIKLEREIRQLRLDINQRVHQIAVVEEELDREIENIEGYLERLALVTGRGREERTSVSSYSPIGNSPLIPNSLIGNGGEQEGGMFIPDDEGEEEKGDRR